MLCRIREGKAERQDILATEFFTPRSYTVMPEHLLCPFLHFYALGCNLLVSNTAIYEVDYAVNSKNFTNSAGRGDNVPVQTPGCRLISVVLGAGYLLQQKWPPCKHPAAPASLRLQQGKSSSSCPKGGVGTGCCQLDRVPIVSLSQPCFGLTDSKTSHGLNP